VHVCKKSVILRFARLHAYTACDTDSFGQAGFSIPVTKDFWNVS